MAIERASRFRRIALLAPAARGAAALARFALLALASAGHDGRAEEPPPYHSTDFQGSKSCEECHPRQYLEWRGSTHAYSLIDPVFLAEYRQAVEDTRGEIGTLCLDCHGTIGVRSRELDISFRRVEGSGLSSQVLEGVSCEACHRAEPPPPGAPIANASFRLTPGDVFYGRLFEPEENEAHASEHSDFMGQSVFCGSCHDVIHKGRSVESAFAEWRVSVHPARGIECQDCHMLRYSGQAAVGSRFRDDLRRHNFPGVATALIPFPNAGYQEEEIERFLRTAARLSVHAPEAVQAGAELALRVRVKNSGTGHNLPSGSMRQMWLEVTVLDEEGGAVFRSGHLDANGDLRSAQSALDPGGDPQLVMMSDGHVDAEGRRVPFWLAERVEMHSLAALEVRNSTYRIAVPRELRGTAVTIRVRLLLRPFPPYGMRQLGVERLCEKLPVWELNRFESEPLPVLDDPPRRTEYLVPGDFDEIQDALDALEDGDRVVVGPGEHRLERPLDFRGKAIHLVSRYGSGRTALRRVPGEGDDGEGSVLVFRGGEGSDTRVEGFTITGGWGTLCGGLRRGGGIHIRRSSPTLVECRVEGNEAAGGVGGGICCDEGSPVIEDCSIRDCRAELGGGLAVRAGREPQWRIRAAAIEGNRAEEGGGIYLERGVDARIERCLLAGNLAMASGGAVHAAEGACVDADHLTVVHNRARRGSGAIHGAGGGLLRVSNSIFWQNRPFAVGEGFRYCIVDRDVDAGSTNLREFPLFVDPGGSWLPRAGAEGDVRGGGERWVSGVYGLLPGSPAIDAGDPASPPDADDTRSDIGALFLEQPLHGFVRGDVDGDGTVGWSDLLRLARHFVGGVGGIPCLDAADVDDGGQVDVLDAVLLSVFLVTGLPEPAAPFPSCGLDPTFGEGLSCEVEPAPCRREPDRRDELSTGRSY
ncbi:MAG: right-handed parallel beta-helix repeat-containing protein [Planctomycetes bacterium]|nr:right-handed parallel beta-helix repeat-containing protein [Planctomycetota bacterium]